MSLPEDPQSPQKGLFGPPQRLEERPRGRRQLWPLWLALLGGLIGWGVLQAPREIGRWQLAKALKLRDEGQKEAAYAELAKAMERLPATGELLLKRGEWKLEDGKEEAAIADFDQALEVAKDKTFVLEKRGDVLLKAGKFERAVADWKELEQESRRIGNPPRDRALNQLAYAQALAKVELDNALENINRAIEIHPGESAFLDTRGYIYYLRKEYEAAMLDLNEAVDGIDKILTSIEPNAVAGAGEAGDKNSDDKNGGEKAGEKSQQRIHVPDKVRQEIVTASAVIHYHRALALEALDRKADAEKDREIARKLIGREPDEKLY